MLIPNLSASLAALSMGRLAKRKGFTRSTPWFAPVSKCTDCVKPTKDAVRKYASLRKVSNPSPYTGTLSTNRERAEPFWVGAGGGDGRRMNGTVCNRNNLRGGVGIYWGSRILFCTVVWRYLGIIGGRKCIGEDTRRHCGGVEQLYEGRTDKRWVK